MSANADFLETLQADVFAILKNTPALATANVLADNQGDIEARVARALGTLSETGGKQGLAVVVLLPEVVEAEANLPGPPLRVKLEIRVLENVLINRAAAKGTLIRSSQAALHALGALHQHCIGGYVLYAEKDPLAPVEVKTGHVSHAVTLYARANGLTGPGKPAAVTAEVTAGAGGGLLVSGDLTYAGLPLEDPTPWTQAVFPAYMPLRGTWNGKPRHYNDDLSLKCEWVTTDGGVWVLVVYNVVWIGTGNTASAADPSIVWSVSPSNLEAAGTPVVTTGGVPHLTLACATAGASIRYSTDGSYPSPAKTLYTAPFALPAAGTVIRAAAYKTGLNPGDATELTVTA